jgi:multiple sugar transport system permease protein
MNPAKKRFNLKDETILFLLLLPGLAGLLAFYVIPFIISLYFSAIDNNVTRNFVWFQNFADTWNNPAFQLGLQNTGIFMAISVPLNIVFPLLMALIINKTSDALKKVFCLIILLPLVIPSASVVHFWNSVFGINGVINGMFFPDAPVNWFNTDMNRVIITLIYIWKNAGYNMVLFLAGLQFIPREYYEYASVEGANALKKFYHITLVYLTPTMFLVLIMSIINSFRVFREIYLISGEYPHQSIYMLQHFMNNQFAALNYQRLATASYILSIFIIAAVLLLYFFQNKRARYL